VSTLVFLSPSRCDPATLASPLALALDGTDPAVVRDLSLEGKVEVRGDLELVAPLDGEELVRLSPRRGLLFTVEDPAEAVERLRAAGVLAYDASGALAGLGIEGERLMRRLTDLDLDRLPAAGPFAQVTGVVLRDEGERFRVYVPQELGHYVAEAVLDAIAGLPDPQTGVRLKPDTGSEGPA
jgi:hypothetical protein